MPLAVPVNKASNQSLLTMQLETSALPQQDLARVPGLLLVPVLLKGLIIQNAAQERLREWGRDYPQHSKRQK